MLSTNVIIVVIAGASGSGKSSLAQNVSAEIATGYRVAILHEDAYYRRQSELDLHQRAMTNYDHPDAIEDSLLVEHLNQIKSGLSVDVPVYDYSIHDRTDETNRLDPPDILIVEGILLLHREAVRELASVCVFVDVQEEVCLERRIERDIRERGRSRECVMDQYARTVGPMFQQYVKPSRVHADIVVSHGGEHAESIDAVVEELHKLIEGSASSR